MPALSRLSRRQMMKLSAGALLAAGLWPGRLRAADAATKPLKFIVVNDLHYADDACRPFFQGLVKEFNKIENAAFLIIAGDLVDTGARDQCDSLKDILGALKIPCHITSGNHDSASQTDRSSFESVFLDGGKKLNFFFEQNGWQFVGLDTSDGIKIEKFDALKPTLDFAASLPAALDKNKPTFLYTHFPLGPGVNMRLQNADILLEPFKQLNLAAIFNGHYHAFTQKTLFASTVVTTNRCCSRKRANHDNTWQKGFFIIEAGFTGDHEFKRTFIEYGTDFAGALNPKGDKPATRPSTDPSAPSY